MSTRKALVIGIDKYPVRPLRSCVNDAMGITEVLKMKEYGFAVTTYLDELATRRAILSELDNLFSGNSDFILFYSAGHGITNSISTYLATIDHDEIDLGIDLDYLRKLVRNKTKELTTVVLLLDCCHSGAGSVRNMYAPISRDIKNDDFDQLLTPLGSGKVLLAACQPHELAYEKPARIMVELYQRCNQQDPKNRIQDFRDISDRLFELIQLLDQSDHEKIIGFKAFARQLAFSIVGMSDKKISSDTTFFSMLGQVQIDVTAPSDAEVTEIRFRLQAQEAPILHGSDSHKNSREIINQRIKEKDQHGGLPVGQIEKLSHQIVS